MPQALRSSWLGVVGQCVRSHFNNKKSARKQAKRYFQDSADDQKVYLGGYRSLGAEYVSHYNTKLK